MRTALKIFGICVGSLAALVLLALGGVQIALKPSNGNRLLEKLLPKVGNIGVRYDSLDMSVAKTWPYIDLTLGGVLVETRAFTEPDTLAYIKSVSAKLNISEFIKSGDVKLAHLLLDDTYVKVLKRDSIYSWDMFPPSEDTTAVSIPNITADTLAIDKARLVFRDFDSHFAAEADGLGLYAAETELLSDMALLKSRLQMGLDSIAYTDSVANRHCTVKDFDLKLNAFRDESQTNLLLFNAKSDNIALKDSMFNIGRTSLDVFARAVAENEFTKFNIDTIGVNLDKTQVSVSGVVEPAFGDTLSVGMENLRLLFDCPSIKRLRAFVPAQMTKYIDDYIFDGAVALQSEANGLYKGKSVPVIDIAVQLKGLNGGLKKYSQRVNDVSLDAVGRFNQRHKDSTFVKINRLHAEAEKNEVDVKGYVCYKNLREYVDLSVLAKLNLKVLNELYKFDPKQRAKGVLTADINGNFFIDDLQNKSLYQIFTKSVVTGDGIGVLIPSYKLGVYVDSLRLNLNTNTSTGSRRRNTVMSAADSLKMMEAFKKMRASMGSQTLKKSARYRYDTADTVLVDTRLAFKSLNVWYKRRVKAKSDRFMASLLADDIQPGKVPRIRTSVSFRGMDLTLDDTIKYNAKRMSASVSVAKHAERTNVPQTSIRFSFDSVTVCSSQVCAMLDTTRISLATTPRLRIGRRKGKTEAQIDSMKRAAAEKIVDMPALIALFDTLSKSPEPMELYMKRFNNEGSIFSRRLRLKDADFPLRMGVSRLDLELNDDTIRLNKVRPRIGRSSVTLSGEITNFRRYLLRGKTLSGNLEMKSRRIDLNQLMRGFYEYNKKQAEKAAQALNQDEMAAMVEQNALDVAMAYDDDGDNGDLELASDSVDLYGLIVLPQNLDLKFTANVDTMLFSKVRFEHLKGDVILKDSRLRVKELSTSTQIGKANMNVMYECATADSARTTMAVSMDSILIGDLVEYIPELDSVLPMLRSFEGRVECDASTELTLDERMNVKLPSVSAALRVRGDSLVLLDGETFSTIAKYLNFSKKTENRIDSISAEVTVKNNEVQIYPFMVSMDRFRLGVGGKQNLDLSFNYHLVVLRPAILSGVGLDVYGKDFDHIKFKLTSPKFKGFDVAIAKGGTLIKTSEVDIRKMMYDAMLEAILKED